MYKSLIILTAVMIILALLIFLTITFLQSVDKKIDYSNKEIKYFIKESSGVTYLVIPYYFWQIGKFNELKRRYTTNFVHDNKNYNIDIIYPCNDHNRQSTDLFFSGLYRDFVAKLSTPCLVSANYGNINNMTISGNSNSISINQTNNDISSEIKRVINNEHFNADDKIFLELFLYKLNDNSVKKHDASKAIDILTKALPFTTAVINMIRTLFFT